MDIQLGWVYKFKFIDGFESLDGVYTLVKKSTYQELTSDGLDLYTNLYQIVGKTEEELNTFIDSYKTQEIFKLVSVDEQSRYIIAPMAILRDVPIYNVQQYSNLVMTLFLGVYPKEEDLSYITTFLQQNLEATLGYTESPKAISISKVWLTDDEYTKLDSDRAVNKTLVLNYFTEVQRLQAIIDKQKAMLDAYNDILVNASKA